VAVSERLLAATPVPQAPRLRGIKAPFNLRYHTSVPLDGNVSTVYSGSLTHVISRLFGGYDYVIAHGQGTIHIVVWGKRGEAPAPV
jgi:hypothetical protein